MTAEKIRAQIAEMNAEGEATMERQAKNLIRGIATVQAQLALATKQAVATIADYRKALAELSFEPVTEEAVVGTPAV